MALRLSEGLGHKFVVLTVRANPKPVNAFTSWQPECSVIQAYPGATHFPAAELFELEGRVRRVNLQKCKVLAGQFLYLGRKAFETPPEAL